MSRPATEIAPVPGGANGEGRVAPALVQLIFEWAQVALIGVFLVSATTAGFCFSLAAGFLALATASLVVTILLALAT